MKKFNIFILFILILSSFTFALSLENKSFNFMEEKADVFNSSGQIAVNNKVKLKDDTFLTDEAKDKQYKLSYNTPKTSRAIKIDKISDYDSEFYDVDVSSISGSKIKFKQIRSDPSFMNISIFNVEGFDTEIVSVQNITLDYAEVTLAKTVPGLITKIYHSYDDINFTPSNIKFDQNITHVWFNTTHFSSFTGFIANIDLTQTDENTQFDVDSYATIDSGHYVRVYIPSDGGTEVITNVGLSGSEYDQARILNDFSDESFDIILNGNNIVQFSTYGSTPFLSAVYDDDLTVCIYSATNVLQDCDVFNVELNEFQLPLGIPIAETGTTATTSTIRGQVNFNDFTGTVEARLCFIEYLSGGSWDCNAYASVTDGQIFTRSLTGLTPDTTYEYVTQYKYTYQSTLYTYYSYNNLFATDPSAEPTATTLSASPIGETTATLRGFSDFGDFTGTVNGKFYYKKVADGSWTSTSNQEITDDTIFTASLTGLTTGDEYHFYSDISWNDGSEKTDQGLTVTFTPQVFTASDLNDAVLYYSFDNEDLSGSNPLDLSGNDFTGTTSGATTGVSGVLNEGFSFDGSNDNVTKSSESTLNFGTGDYTISLWVYDERNSVNANPIIISKARFDTSWDGFYLLIEKSTGKLTFMNADNGAYQYVVSSSGITANEWHHIVLVRAGTSVKIYSDNSLFASDTLTVQDVSNTFNLVIGGVDSGSNYFDGYVEEVGIWNYAFDLNDVNTIYNSDLGLNPYTYVPPVTTVSTIAQTNVTSNSVSLRGIADIQGFSGDVYGTFQYKLASDSSWTNVGDTVNPIINDTVFSYTLSNLTPFTEYDFRAVLTWYDGESLNAFGENLSFTTLKTRTNATNIGVDSQGLDWGYLAFYSNLNDMTWMAYSISWAEYSDILGGSPTWTNEDLVNVTSEGYNYYNLTNLTPSTKYGYFFAFADEYGTYYSELYDFTPGEENLPQLGLITFDYTGAREEIDVNLEVTSLANYTAIRIDTLVSEHEENVFVKNQTAVYTSIGNNTFRLYNLSINQSYDVIFQVTYPDGIYNTSAYYFQTLSLADILPPAVSNIDYEANFGIFSITTEVIMGELDIVSLRYVFPSTTAYLLGVGGIFISEDLLSYVSTFEEINESGNYTRIFNNTNLGTITVYPQVRYYNGSQPTPEGPIQDDYYAYITDSAFSINIKPEDITTGEKTIIGNFKINIDNPYLFTVMIICGFSILGLCLSLGSLASQEMNGLNRFLIYITTGLTFVIIIWLYLAEIIPLWELISIVVGVVVIGVYLMLSESRGGVYG